MARGITEYDVHTAADALVANGERPTVERIRAHLGTGSPNTVIRWLDTWWNNLGLRLQPQTARLAEAPPALAELAGQWWAQALAHAREAVLLELEDAHKALSSEYDELRSQRQDFVDEAVGLRAEAEAASQAEQLAVARSAELQRQVDHLQNQTIESSRQFAAMEQRLLLAESARQSADLRLHETQELARSERESLLEHIRSVEDRALRDVDTARQESRGLQMRLSTANKNHLATESELRQALDQARTALNAATADADRLRGSNAALEEQLARLQRLPADLEAAVRRAQQPARQRRSRVRPVPTR